MTGRNPNPDPEIFELTSTRKTDGPGGSIDLPLASATRCDNAEGLSAGVNRGAYHIWTIGCQMNVADSNHVPRSWSVSAITRPTSWTRPTSSC